MPSPKRTSRVRRKERAEKREPITISTARELLDYDPSTGDLRWRVGRPRGLKAGDVAGGFMQSGYRRISLLERVFMSHQLAWAIHHGRWPAGHIDHVNGNPSDNRIENLRECTASQNQANRKKLSTNTSGLRGVTWNRSAKKWQAGIKLHGRSYHLGLYADKNDAHAAYQLAARRLFGEFSS